MALVSASRDTNAHAHPHAISGRHNAHIIGSRAFRGESEEAPLWLQKPASDAVCVRAVTGNGKGLKGQLGTGDGIACEDGDGVSSDRDQSPGLKKSQEVRPNVHVARATEPNSSLI